MLQHETAPDCNPESTVPHVALEDGRIYLHIGYDTMLLLQRDLHLPTVHVAGWTTAHVGSIRLAAWTEVVR